jgi:hypothetical protein
MRSPCCLCVCESHPINYLMTEPNFMELGMYIMKPGPISTTYYINPSHQSVCLYVYPIIAMQRLGKNVIAGNEYTRNNRRIVGSVVFYAVRVMSKKLMRLVLPRTSCFYLSTALHCIFRP